MGCSRNPSSSRGFRLPCFLALHVIPDSLRPSSAGVAPSVPGLPVLVGWLFGAVVLLHNGFGLLRLCLIDELKHEKLLHSAVYYFVTDLLLDALCRAEKDSY